MFPLRFAAPVKVEMLFFRHPKAGHHHSASPRAQHCLSMVVSCSTDKQRAWKRIQHSGISAHDWFAQTYLLVFSAQGELICNRRAWDVLSPHPSTHNWERITTVSSSNATAVASPISRPRKTAAKKVTTQITCREQKDINGYEHDEDWDHEPQVRAATSELLSLVWYRMSIFFLVIIIIIILNDFVFHSCLSCKIGLCSPTSTRKQF